MLTINNKTFSPDEFGTYNLTEIWSDLGLPKTAAPSQWRHRQRSFLEKNGDVFTSYGSTISTLAGALGWVSWFDYEVYVSTLTHFTRAVAGAVSINRDTR